MAADEKTPADDDDDADDGKTAADVNKSDGEDDEEEDGKEEDGEEAEAAATPRKKKVGGRLPPRVERALEAARVAAKADRERKGGRWLAIVPATIGVVILALMMPRAAAPDAIPIPQINQRALEATLRADEARATDAEAERLPGEILALGSAIREANRSEARGDDVERLDSKRRLDTAVRLLPKRATLIDELGSLRAVQTRRFLAGVANWEATGQSSEDLVDLGGSFIARIRDAGWVGENRHILMSDVERRIAFKLVWNVLVGVDSVPSLAVTLDEHRALYAFSIEHPHPPEAHRLGLESQRSSAKTPEECTRANAETKRQTEMWLAEKIKKLSAIDQSYPGAYALGVVYYRASRYDLSAEAFNVYVAQHPDGPFALRAKNHLKAAIAAGL